jgi:hypothetical protein
VTPLLPLFDSLSRETYDHHDHLSFPVSDIERTLDAMSWIHVRLFISRGANLTGNGCVAQYVPLAYRRQPELPARRA